jgi:hypothetical protein
MAALTSLQHNIRCDILLILVDFLKIQVSRVFPAIGKLAETSAGISIQHKSL